MPVLREVVGDTLRSMRLRQRRTLREVSGSARVSLGYLSEVERGQKEASSELLSAICGALDVELSELFGEVATTLRREEKLAQHLRIAGEPLRMAPTAPDGATSGSTSAATSAVTASVRSLPTVAA